MFKNKAPATASLQDIVTLQVQKADGTMCDAGNMKDVRRGISSLPVFISWAQTSVAESSVRAALCSQGCLAEPRLDVMLLCQT